MLEETIATGQQERVHGEVVSTGATEVQLLAVFHPFNPFQPMAKAFLHL